MRYSNLTSALFGAALILFSASGHATENGSPTTPAGLYDFGAGFMPPPSPVGTFGLRTAFYSTNTLKDGSGNDQPVDFSLDLLSIGLAYLRMTDRQILGARYGWGAVLPFFAMDASLEVPTPFGTVSDSAELFRQADLQVLPLILQWNPAPNLGINTQFQIQAPTGDYDQDRLVSPGLNHWTFSPILNATYISDSGFEISSSFQLDVNTRNRDTDYRSGVEYRHDFALGQQIGNWTAGIGGYYYHQLTDDDGPGLTDGNRAQVLALGPALSFFQPGLPAVSLHAYKEFEARNRAEGYTVALRIGKTF
ncbi:SphA family protein [Halomonas faecis]|uniref:SphA family protein n=1 Tax=Halomonas faecis TaxID=1562110 RepID=UPI0013CFC348|nr:transporter [Halomonas faecis]